MFNFIKDFLADVVKNMVEYLLDNLSNTLLGNIIDPTSSMNGISFEPIFNYMMGIVLSYCVLKFLMKLFNIYILGTDGDSDNPPSVLVINFIKALALILAFSSLYEIFIDIIKDIATNLLSSITSLPTKSSYTLINELLPDGTGFLAIIIIIISIVMYIIRYIDCLKTAVLLLILRAGFPLVASGVMDSNGGMFSTYIQKFLQLSFTVITKLALLKLGLLLLLNNNPIWAAVVLTAGGKVGELLKEFMLTSQGGTGRFSSATMTVSNLQRIYGNVRGKK